MLVSDFFLNQNLSPRHHGKVNTMTQSQLLGELSYELELIKALRTQNEGKETYVVANDLYVHVRENYGLNFTDFLLVAPFSARYATIFYSKYDAESRGMDYNLIDGEGKKVELKIIPATEFYSKVIEMIQTIIKHLKISSK